MGLTYLCEDAAIHLGAWRGAGAHALFSHRRQRCHTLPLLIYDYERPLANSGCVVGSCPRNQPGLHFLGVMTLSETIELEAKLAQIEVQAFDWSQSAIALGRRVQALENSIAVAAGYIRSGQYEAALQILEARP